jgi:hypothetical protein
MLNFSKKHISSFIICPSKQGIDRFNWIEEYKKDYVPEEVSKHIDKLEVLYKQYQDSFNDYGYLVVPKDIFHNQIMGMINDKYKYYEDDEVIIFYFDNKLDMFYKPFFLPAELSSSLKYFGINKINI